MTEVGDAGSRHWNAVYARRGPRELSWYQSEPAVSLDLIERAGVLTDAPVVDVGAGTSALAGRLLDRGFVDVTVLDVSADALAVARSELGARAPAVVWLATDVLQWRPSRRYALWHDRAVFHFLVDAEERRRYVATATAAVREGGHVVMGVFASDGPTECSGLPTARYDAPDLARLFSPAFVLVDALRDVHVTPAGVAQAFTWVVLERVAPPG